MRRLRALGGGLVMHWGSCMGRGCGGENLISIPIFPIHPETILLQQLVDEKLLSPTKENYRFIGKMRYELTLLWSW